MTQAQFLASSSRHGALLGEFLATALILNQFAPDPAFFIVHPFVPAIFRVFARPANVAVCFFELSSGRSLLAL